MCSLLTKSTSSIWNVSSFYNTFQVLNFLLRMSSQVHKRARFCVVLWCARMLCVVRKCLTKEPLLEYVIFITLEFCDLSVHNMLPRAWIHENSSGYEENEKDYEHKDIGLHGWICGFTKNLKWTQSCGSSHLETGFWIHLL